MLGRVKAPVNSLTPIRSYSRRSNECRDLASARVRAYKVLFYETVNILPGQPITFQLDKTSPEVHGIRKFITIYARARYPILFQTR